MNRIAILLVSVLSFGIAGGLPAQKVAFIPEFYLGANGGTTLSMVNFKPSVPQSFLMGYHGGLVMRYNSQNHLGTQAELNYSQRGWNEPSGNSRRLDYIELPFMSHFYFGNKVQFYFNIGPKVSILVGESVLAGTSDAAQYTSIARPLDYGFCGGFGFQFKTGKQIVLIDTRANFSVANIFPDRTADYFTTSNHLNASVSAAWLLRTN